MTSTDHTCTVPQIADGQRTWVRKDQPESLGQMAPGRRAPRRRPR